MPQRQNLDEILAAARKLPLEARAELAEMLLRDDEAPGGAATKQQTLTLLVGMTDTELCTLAGAMVAPGRQRRMTALLRKISLGETLGGAQQRELDGLLEEADRIALLKAKAAYTQARRFRGGVS